MKKLKRSIVLGLLLVMVVSGSGVGGCTPVTATMERKSSAPTPVCSGTFTSVSGGAFGVSPQTATPVCVRSTSTSSWQRLSGTGNADYAHGVGTFLGGDAVVTFPGTEGDLEMWSDPETEIQLPPSTGGELELIRGKIYVEWHKYKKNKAIGKICADTSTCIDPEFAVFEFSYDAPRETAEVQVYGGQIIVSRPEMMDQVLLPWQRAILVPKVAAEIKAVTSPPVAKIVDRLAEAGVATRPPWQPLDLELERDPALDVIDPRFAADWGSQQVYLQLMEGLFSFDAQGDVVLAGATELEVSEDGLEHVLKLREEALWSDGMPVVAQHYVDGICRVAAPESEVPQANELYFIEGLKEFHEGDGSCEGEGIRVVDDFTLAIRTTTPLADLGSALTTPLAYPVRLDAIEGCGDEWTEPNCFVSNGRYVLEVWSHGEFLNLVRNPNYWDAEKVEPERLEFSVGKD